MPRWRHTRALHRGTSSIGLPWRSGAPCTSAAQRWRDARGVQATEAAVARTTCCSGRHVHSMCIACAQHVHSMCTACAHHIMCVCACVHVCMCACVHVHGCQAAATGSRTSTRATSFSATRTRCPRRAPSSARTTCALCSRGASARCGVEHAAPGDMAGQQPLFGPIGRWLAEPQSLLKGVLSR